MIQSDAMTFNTERPGKQENGLYMVMRLEESHTARPCRKPAWGGKDSHPLSELQEGMVVQGIRSWVKGPSLFLPMVT